MVDALPARPSRSAIASSPPPVPLPPTAAAEQRRRHEEGGRPGARLARRAGRRAQRELGGTGARGGGGGGQRRAPHGPQPQGGCWLGGSGDGSCTRVAHALAVPGGQPRADVAARTQHRCVAVPLPPHAVACAPPHTQRPRPPARPPGAGDHLQPGAHRRPAGHLDDGRGCAAAAAAAVWQAAHASPAAAWPPAAAASWLRSRLAPLTGPPPLILDALGRRRRPCLEGAVRGAAQVGQPPHGLDVNR